MQKARKWGIYKKSTADLLGGGGVWHPQLHGHCCSSYYYGSSAFLPDLSALMWLCKSLRLMFPSTAGVGVEMCFRNAYISRARGKDMYKTTMIVKMTSLGGPTSAALCIDRWDLECWVGEADVRS